MKDLKTGDVAPGFALRDQSGATVNMEDFRGRKLLVYFYPRASTPGCTRQSCAVSKALPDFSRLGIAAVGISPDPPARNKKFDEKHGLGFPLLSDEELVAAESFGVLRDKSLFGKLTRGVLRTSFLIDEEGRLEGVWYGVKPDETVPLALAALGR